MRKTVYVCEDHPLYRQSLEELINGKEGLDLLGSCGDGATALETFAEFVPDLVLLDLNLPKKDGFEVLEFLNESTPKPLVVILTSYDDKIIANKARKSGANAYLLKDTEGEELIRVIQTIRAGEFYSNVSGVKSHQFEPDQEFASILKLTRTEKKLVKQLIDGASVANLADQFHISENTVKNHKKNIYRKLGVKTQSQLILLCQKHGLLD
jgi:DNA-binding NarL/FixJ family response regulator